MSTWCLGSLRESISLQSGKTQALGIAGLWWPDFDNKFHQKKQALRVLLARYPPTFSHLMLPAALEAFSQLLQWLGGLSASYSCRHRMESRQMDRLLGTDLILIWLISHPLIQHRHFGGLNPNTAVKSIWKTCVVYLTQFSTHSSTSLGHPALKCV